MSLSYSSVLKKTLFLYQKCLDEKMTLLFKTRKIFELKSAYKCIYIYLFLKPPVKFELNTFRRLVGIWR